MAPGPRVSAWARAAPSPGRASSRARVGVVLAATLHGILLGVVPGAPPGLPTQIGPGDNSQRTAQGGGWAGSPRAQEGRPLSAWSAPSAKQPMRSRSKPPARCCRRRLCVRSFACRRRRHRRRHCVPWRPPSRGRPIRESSELGYTRASRMRQASGNPRPLVQGPADPGLQIRNPVTQDVKMKEMSRGVPPWGQGPKGGAR